MHVTTSSGSLLATLLFVLAIHHPSSSTAAQARSLQELSSPKEIDEKYAALDFDGDDEIVLGEIDEAIVDDIDDDEWWKAVTHSLEKRRGGGGGGGGGRGSSSGSSSSSGGRSGSSSSSSSSSGRSGSGASSSKSNAGGRTSSGSGTPKSFGSGSSKSYAGGAAVPYSAGKRSASGITPYLLPIAALGVFGAGSLWLAGAYAYPYHNHIIAHNNTSNKNESLPVLCLCQQYSVCGCDESNSTDYSQQLFDNATAAGNITNGTFTSKIADVNGTETIVVNGTLANGTTSDGGTGSAAGALRDEVVRNFGVWVVIGVVGWVAWMQ